MTMYTEKDCKIPEGGRPHVPLNHRGPLSPHEQKGLLQIEFNEKDRNTFQLVFGDGDTASAAMEIIKNAPPEIQILAIQIIDIIEEVV